MSWPRSSTQRISPSARTIRYSSTNGRSWSWACLTDSRIRVPVVGVDDAHQGALGAGDEVGRRVAGDALDLVADQRQLVVVVPGGAVDRARHVDHQRAQQRVVRALLGSVDAGADAGEELGAGERAREVVVRAGLQRLDGGTAVLAVGDRQQPRLAEPRVVAQGLAADGSGVAADEDQLRGRVGQRFERRLRRRAPRGTRSRRRAATGRPLPAARRRAAARTRVA